MFKMAGPVWNWCNEFLIFSPLLNIISCSYLHNRVTAFSTWVWLPLMQTAARSERCVQFSITFQFALLRYHSVCRYKTQSRSAREQHRSKSHFHEFLFEIYPMYKWCLTWTFPEHSNILDLYPASVYSHTEFKSFLVINFVVTYRAVTVIEKFTQFSWLK